MEGYFRIKVSSLGARLCLLEDREEGELGDLIASGAYWMHKWFVEVKRWEPKVVDDKRVTWVKLFGLPCHMWNDELFKFISNPFGTFIRVNDITLCQAKIDVARFLIRTSCLTLIGETFMVKASDLVLRLQVIEDTQGPLRICTSRMVASEFGSLSSEEVDEDRDDVDADSEV